MMIWDEENRVYTGRIDEMLITVEGDVFAETEQDLRDKYIEDGLSFEQAEQKAWCELRDAVRWYGDFKGVTITPMEKEEGRGYG